MTQAVKFKDAEVYEMDFSRYSTFSSGISLKRKGNMPIPAGLGEAVMQEFLSICRSFCVDASKYTHCQMCCISGMWSATFYQNEAFQNASIQVYEIYYDEEKKNIMQSCFSFDA